MVRESRQLRSGTALTLACYDPPYCRTKRRNARRGFRLQPSSRILPAEAGSHTSDFDWRFHMNLPQYLQQLRKLIA